MEFAVKPNFIRYFDKSVLILNTNELKYKATTDHNFFLHQETGRYAVCTYNDKQNRVVVMLTL